VGYATRSRRARRQAIYETVTIIGLRNRDSSPVEVTLEFDEISLEVEIEYEGSSFEMANRPPAVDDIGSDDSVIAMASYLIGQYTERVRMKSRSGRCQASLYFDH
jgi:hypothetical protein